MGLLEFQFETFCSVGVHYEIVLKGRHWRVVKWVYVLLWIGWLACVNKWVRACVFELALSEVAGQTKTGLTQSKQNWVAWQV